MSQSAQKIGMMDPAYFLGRREILEWINTVCQLNLSKVEQTCTGAVACQLLDAIYPGKVPMSKVDWTARDQYQYVNNYKVLQNCFGKMHIDKPIHVDKLIRGRSQDNLEFMQWFKAFYDLNAGDADYDAVARRNRGKGGQEYTNKFRGSGAPKPASRTGSDKSLPTASRGSKTRPPAAPRASSNNASNKASSSKQDDELVEQYENTIEKLKEELEGVKASNTEFLETIDGLEKERDFYFEKLRNVELHCQEIEKDNVSEDVNALATRVLDLL